MKRLIPLFLLAGYFGVQAARPAEPGALADHAQESAPGGADAGDAPADVAVVDASTTQLGTDLAEIIGRPGWTGDEWGVLVVSLDRGDTLWEHNASLALAPASNIKLFTTAAALYYLGPGFRYNTFLMATGPIRDGVLDGDLVVYGTGDPTFSTRFGERLEVWQSFADSLRALGVREVRGDVVGDGSYFEGPGAGAGWQESYMNASYAASAGALSYTENVAMLEIGPGDEPGWRPTVRLVPGGEGIAIVNQATTVASGTTRVLARRIAYDGPILVTGQIARNASPVLRSVPVSDPARYAAAMFREVLMRNDIYVAGTVRSAQTREESSVTSRSIFAPALDSQAPVRVLAVRTSPPLQQILNIINQRSHNLMAEQVLRTVGRVALGEGSVESGASAIRHMIEREGGRGDGLEVYDGSGLSVLNRASAAAIVELLTLMAKSPQWTSYLESLPEAGGPNLRRMQQTGAQGNLRAKTGTIDRVSALSGYVTAGNGERLAFSIISNNVPSTWMAKRVEDAIGGSLAQFTRPAGLPVGRPPAGTPPDAAPPPSPAPAPPAPPTADSAATSPQTHTIRSGDTFDALARRYGTTVRAIEEANPGIDPRRLIPGRTIRIPQ